MAGIDVALQRTVATARELDAGLSLLPNIMLAICL